MKQMENKMYANHLGCEVQIKWRERFNPQTKKIDAIPGLYCKKHRKLIKWLNLTHAYELINEFKVEEA